MQPEEKSRENRLKGQGDRLRQARRDREMTIHQVSMLTGIPYNNVGSWERGERDPTLEHLRTLCEALEIDVRWVIYGDGLGEGGPTHSKGNTQHEQQLLASQAV